MKRLLIVLIIFQCFAAIAQTGLKPAPPQSEAIILLNGTAHLGNGEVIENAAVGFEDGKITLVADSKTIRVDASKARVIDVTGKHIYPGIISPNTNIGLVEIWAVRATRDQDETGAYNPNVRSLIAYNTDSDVIPTVRSNGILLAESAPQGGRISGTSSVMKLDGWNWEDAVYKKDIGIHLNWPGKYRYTGRRTDSPELKVMDEWKEELNELESFFDDAQSYCASEGKVEKNLKLEAMCPVLTRERKVFIHVNKAHDILRAISFAKKYELDAVLTGANDAWQVTDEIKASGYPVILGTIHSLPATQDSDIDQPFKTPAQLQEAGILFCLSKSGGWSFWDQRNLPFIAGTAAAHGLSKEEALMAITYNTAKILGMDEYTGTLEEGKDANIIVSDGDILDMKSGKITNAFILGSEIDLDNKQKILYRKFMGKYGLSIPE